MTEEVDSPADAAQAPETPDVPADFRCGFVAIIGRPNVGKSTLLNAVLGRKVSIVSPKPQTTRHRILGILNQPLAQIVFVDTPGLHTNERRAMNRYMNRAARASLSDADINLFVVEALTWNDDDQQVLQYLKHSNRPTMLIVNKVDTVYPKERLLPYIQEMQRRMEFAAIVPLSGLKKNGLEQLPVLLAKHLPLSPPHYPQEQITDRSEQFQATEVIREKLTLRLNQELPYGITVQIERFETQEDGRLLINAIIWVERTGQKAIVIGKGGEGLKEVGRLARLELKHLFGKSVHLELWVKVKENWSDSEAALRQLGFE